MTKNKDYKYLTDKEYGKHYSSIGWPFCIFTVLFLLLLNHIWG